MYPILKPRGHAKRGEPSPSADFAESSWPEQSCAKGPRRAVGPHLEAVWQLREQNGERGLGAELMCTCAFFSRSDIGARQSGMSLSSSKVMMTKASVEPLNCSSWWPAMQCCSCLVRDATWREGFL